MQVDNKKTPTLYTKKEDCCGCYACENMCPVNAIKMEPDETGFMYPLINADICVGCGMCIKVCPIKNV
ncbi:4Fe-4S dicluster domain-containing protein [Lachnospiraceae bacterium]|nr:4Fe-4S dicluster domain-containing protein [Lachnospiraceae bacterium]